MNTKQTILKLQGHTSQLLTLYLMACRKYAMLEPTIRSGGLNKKFDTTRKRAGLHTIRTSLYLSIIQDISNMVFDSGPRNPSLITLKNALDKSEIKSILEHQYLSDGNQANNYNRFRCSKDFEDLYAQFLVTSTNILANPIFMSAKSARDTLIAHIDVKFIDGNYEYPDIKKLNLKWSDAGNMLHLFKTPIMNANMIIRDASFAWQEFEKQNTLISSEFWQ
ncbi:hypothetical protein DOK_09661 [gamma proteobacterium BDW918]|uniref:HEPN AbiU2-like domain-containing protein n=1 Tax=Zhongshania aliphaticivorans TaxID=1470434 RepID=A0A127M604_9GAMM|nr:hypothetical protein [Zhongshania aliphaticivorans]AMO68639.1 hypothetical protein AZF00_10170 [Zhongshania aliphaticivorans]EIF43122.1 hypothetical protein DOK_09661 [gamma proteobacterium BDW918]